MWARFGLRSAADVEIVHGFAFNQGFYNLFLAIGVGLGISLMVRGGGADEGLVDAGRAIAMFACGSMAAAGAVLIATDRRFARAAALQIVPGVAAVVLLLLAA